MRPAKKGQLIGGLIGMILGCLVAYMIWGIASPGGIVILFAFAIGGLIGYNLGLKKEK
jgi:hypothetical protein